MYCPDLLRSYFFSCFEIEIPFLNIGRDWVDDDAHDVHGSGMMRIAVYGMPFLNELTGTFEPL